MKMKPFAVSALLTLALLPLASAEEQKAAAAPAPKRFTSFQAFSVPDAKVEQTFTDKLTEEIQILTRLGKQRSDPNSKADILHRLADAYLTYDKALYFRQMAAYVKAFDAYNKGVSKVKPGEEPKYRPTRALRLYKTVLETAPQYSRTDEVLFYTGYYGAMLGDKDSIGYYQKMIQKYPRSRYFLDAQMELGNGYFDNRQFDEAIKAYKTVLREPSRIYNFALYQLAWCYYNQAKTRAAMTVMQQVVKSSKGVQNEIELREEALRDLVVFYSDLGLIDEAEQYFTSIGEPDYAYTVLEKLSDIYYKQARYDKAVETIKRLLTKKPMGPDAPRYHSKLVESYEKSQRLNQALVEMNTFIVTYGKQAPWFNQNSDPDARDYAVERTEVYARFIPKKYHEQAQQIARTDPSKAEAYFQQAVLNYKRYLELYPDHKNSYEMRFLYAELLFKRKNYEEAAREFDRVAKADVKGPRHKDALIGEIDAYTRLEEVYYKDLEAKGIKKKGKYDSIPMSPYAEALIAADEFYVRSFPKDPKVPDTLLHRAQLFYNYNQLSKAQKSFYVIVNNYPDSPASNTARHLILDIYNINKDWENLEKSAALFLQNKQFATPENRELLLKLIQGSIFQRAKELEEKKKYRPAAEMYLRLSLQYPDSEYADKAMFNAAIDYINADDSKKAMETSNMFLAKYPKSDLVPKMMLALASYFDDKLDYAHAAMYYELLAEKDPKSPQAPDALYNAGLYRENLRHYAKALEDYNQYLERFPKAKDAGEIFFSIGVVHEKKKDYRNAIQQFQEYPRKYSANKERVIEAYFKSATDQIKIRDMQGAIKSYQTVIWLNQKYNKDPSLGKNIGGKYAAKARFELVKPDLEEFEAIRFRMPQAVLARAIEDKARLLTRLKNKYLEIINFGDAEMGVAALYHIGLIYQNFSDALFNAPVPKGLKPEEVQLYQQELQNRAAPIEEKAVEAYEKAVAKSQELEVYTEWSKKAYTRLTQYKPDRYPPIRGRMKYENHISEPIAPYSGPVKAAKS
jgi:cellulose synthase operon protein C